MQVKNTLDTTSIASDSTSILVLGAGELGLSVLRELAAMTSEKRGALITVLLRSSAVTSEDPSKRQVIEELHRLNIVILEADIIRDSAETLAAHFSAFDTIISCVGFVAGSGTQLKITRAVLAAGVKRYVPWQFGVDYDMIGKGSPQDLFDEQLEVRTLLRAQHACQWTIISTGMFTSFLFEPVFGVVDLAQNTVHALGSWDNQVTVTTPEDIGMLTARILFAEPRLVDQAVYVAGDTLTYGQLADTVDAMLDRKVERVQWSVPKLRDDLACSPDDQMKKYRAVFAEGNGVAWDQDRTFNAAHGIALTTVAGWIEQNLG